MSDTTAAPVTPTATPWLERLNPAWFGCVMATGIVSIAAELEGVPVVAEVLFWLSVFAYGVLWLALLARVVRHPGAVVEDLGHHLRGMGFFTVVAGTAVLGAASLLVATRPGAAKVLWVLALVLWVVVVYTVPVAQTLREPKPEVQSGITGTWLLWVVATQGVSLLGTQVAKEFGAHAGGVVFLALCLWLLGVMIYVWVMSLILHRLFFAALEPAQLSPTYWITMGAAAISTLAGSLLVLAAPGYPVTADLVPFVKGLTVLVWATATWWIPWLVVMGVWRYVVRRDSIAFEPGLWGMVFPIGMYATATFKLAEVLDYPLLADVPAVAVWIALGAWAFTFVDMVVTLTRRPLPAGAI